MVDSARARRKRYIPTPISENRTTSVAIQAARSGRITKSPTKGYNAPALKPARSGVPLNMYWFQNGS